MVQIIAASDSRLSWHGHVSLQATEDGVQPWRLPYDRLDLFPPETLPEQAKRPAGVRLALHSDTGRIAGRASTNVDTSPIDLYVDGEMHGSVELAEKDAFEFPDLPVGAKLLELWLPQFGQFRLRDIELDEGASLAPFEDTRPRWITYGSSITHCRQAASPSTTWPAIVARAENLNLTCLGFGGNCHLEPMVARMIRELPADFISICAGINIQGGASLGRRTLRAALIGFIEIVREGHPQTPFAVISPICSLPREETPNILGLDLRAIRAEVAAAVEALQRHGDKNLFYVDGLELFGPELVEYLPDQLHPNARGYELLAENFLKVVAPRLFHNADKRELSEVGFP